MEWLGALPPGLLYAFIGAGAAVENFMPPIPADTFVLFGAFLAETGRADPWLVFLFTWIPNVASGFLVYRLAYRYGRHFFGTPAGRWLLHPGQLDQVAVFYGRWGTPAIFFSRFIPGVRAMVPVFAGISHMPATRVLFPMALASGIWYGTIVYVGAAAGRNWDALVDWLERVSGGLAWVGIVVGIILVGWWIWSRRHKA